MRIVVGSDGAIPSFGNFCVNEATGGAVFHAASSSLPSIVGGSLVCVAATCGGDEATRSARMGAMKSIDGRPTVVTYELSLPSLRRYMLLHVDATVVAHSVTPVYFHRVTSPSPSR